MFVGGTNVSKPFYIENGVRQGGLLSPKLFKVHLDGLSVLLNSLPVGCNIGGTVINHLAYADDVVLISPSIKGLQRLVDQCVSFGDDFDISFNRRKTVCMAITANNYVMLNHLSLLLHDAPLRLPLRSIIWVFTPIPRVMMTMTSVVRCVLFTS